MGFTSLWNLTIPIDEDVLRKVSTIIGGEEAARVVIALKELGEATDDQILVKTGTKLNDVRKYSLNYTKSFNSPMR